ncbi:hypothetical protein [Komarekiella delphini-convector]|nr:hypothetical protein [Komarekiella delphini-convector]
MKVNLVSYAFEPMKIPNECENMVDIRAEIVRLDHQVIALIDQRL